MFPSVPKPGSPKKGEVKMPIPMAMEKAAEIFKRLGICPQIDQWRDMLQQVFSDLLLNPLVRKIDSSLRQVGGSKQDGGLIAISSDGSQQEWLTTMARMKMLSFISCVLLFCKLVTDPSLHSMSCLVSLLLRTEYIILTFKLVLTL